MIFHILFIASCFIGDLILAALFPVSFEPMAFVFIPCLGFSALVLSSKHMNNLDSFLLFIFFGLLVDYFLTDTFLVYTIVFGMNALIVNQWQKHLMDSLIESVLLVIATIFVKEFLVYLFMSITSMTQMALMDWVLRRLALTLFINGCFVFVIVFAMRFAEDVASAHERKIRKEESISWLKLFLRR